MRLKINLATRTYLNQRQLNLIFLGIAVVLIVALGVNIKSIATAFGETDAVTGDIRALESKSGSSGRKVSEAEYKDLVSQISSANAIIYRKTYSWLNLLNKLENVVPEGVSLKQIEPDTRENKLKLAGTTISFPKLRTLLENMENSQDFSDIYLVSQAEAKVGETQKGIAFSLVCKVKK